MAAAPKTIQEILRHLTDVIRLDIFRNRTVPPPRPCVQLVDEDAYWSILPSFWYWLPRGGRTLGREALRQVRNSINYFPHVGVVGRSRWVDFALGGVMMQVVDFRLYLILQSPPAVDVVEAINNTLEWFSFIILNYHNELGYWWFTEVRGIEPFYRSSMFPHWTMGYLDGTLRCHPQALPLLYVETTP